MGVAAILAWTQFMVSWPYDMFMDNCALLAISFLDWPYWPILHLTNPQAIILVFGPGRSFQSSTGLWPLGPTSYIKGAWAIEAPYGLWSVGPLGPFWPKSNEAKRGPPEPVMAPNPNQLRNGQKQLGTQNWP
ncbi:hypothetical protein O181_070135 [Austropuccinia psidii MF-1]|uniref:Uncharacterized protein n=1 Tax=Austropuccinia psidii MF-1 TaxID=1389203 RepID=A0A9Q3F480_9BASI|nr:hypothetical protein [Austropuccinia psidii MF-1]